MIHIEQGQKIYNNDEFVVLDPTGDYDNDALILCAHRSNPTEPYSKFEAQYVGYGGMVYEITDEAQLLKEIQDIDPSTLIDIPSIDEVTAVDPFNQKVADMATEPVSTAPTPTDPAPYFAPAEPTVPVVSTTTPGTDLLNSSTTPAVDVTPPLSTTTPAIEVPPIFEEATSTPVIDIPVPPVDTTPIVVPDATSTPL